MRRVKKLHTYNKINRQSILWFQEEDLKLGKNLDFLENYQKKDELPARGCFVTVMLQLLITY
jgi:hypothetical protein